MATATVSCASSTLRRASSARTTKRGSHGARPARRVPLAHRAQRVPRGHPVPRASRSRRASPALPGRACRVRRAIAGRRGRTPSPAASSHPAASSSPTRDPYLTVTHVASGQYGISITLGQRCPIPTLSPYQNSDVISWGYGGGCGGGSFASQVDTSSGADQAWSYHFLGEEILAVTARSAQSADGGWRQFASTTPGGIGLAREASSAAPPVRGGIDAADHASRPPHPCGFREPVEPNHQCVRRSLTP